MFSSYLRIAFRNLFKRKGYSLLNIFGPCNRYYLLPAHLSVCFFERSYDQFNEKAGNIFRLRLDEYQQGKLSWQSATSYPAIGPDDEKRFS